MTSDAPGAAPADDEQRARGLRACFGDEIALLTGFPGARAQALLELLLEREPELTLWLVVPKDALEAAKERLSRHAHARERIRLIAGEPCAIDLGLSRQLYAELAARVDRWFACYQTSDSLVSRELSFRVNLGAAREVAALCKAADRLTHVTFASSSIVFGDHHLPVGEDSLAVGQGFPSAAAEALALGEALLRRRLSDVPLSVVRTPQVLGARGSDAPRPSSLHRLFAVLASAPSDAPLPLPAGAQRLVQALPADFVAEALYAVSALGTRGHAYHFADPDPPPLAEVLEQAALFFGKRLEAASGARALGRLLLRSSVFWLSPQSSRALSDWTEGAQLLTRGGDRLLERAGVRAPSLLSYLEQVLRETEQLVQSTGLQSRVGSAPFEVLA